MNIDYKKLGKAQDLIEKVLTTDGEHHKQWYLQQIAEVLEMALDIEAEYDFEKGIAP